MILVQMYLPKYPMEAYLAARTRLFNALDGITEYPMCSGVWRSPDGKQMQEGVVVISAVVEEPMVEVIDCILMQYKLEAKQECVLYTTQQVNAVSL